MKSKSRRKPFIRPCFTCGGETGTSLYKQSFQLENNHPLPSTYDVVACERCGNVFADVDASQSNYDVFYESFSKYENSDISSGSGTTKWDNVRLNKTADTITSSLNNRTNLSILDVGTAQGGLLEILRKRGFQNLHGLDPSQKCLESTAAQSEGSINTISGSLNKNLIEKLAGQTFDVIVLSHVLEHVYDIDQAVQTLKSLMHQNSLLYIEVPDASKYTFYYKTPFHFFDLEHINHFCESSLMLLFLRNGFEVVDYGSKEIEVSSSELYPAIYCMFKRSNLVRIINTYITKSRDQISEIDFSRLVSMQTPVAIWGVGSYTKQLLANTDLARCNIAYMVDGDSKKWNTLVGKHEILSPNSLQDFEGLILITSALYSTEIADQIVEMGLNNEVKILN